MRIALLLAVALVSSANAAQHTVVVESDSATVTVHSRLRLEIDATRTARAELLLREPLEELSCRAIPQSSSNQTRSRSAVEVECSLHARAPARPRPFPLAYRIEEVRASVPFAAPGESVELEVSTRQAFSGRRAWLSLPNALERPRGSSSTQEAHDANQAVEDSPQPTFAVDLPPSWRLSGAVPSTLRHSTSAIEQVDDDPGDHRSRVRYLGRLPTPMRFAYVEWRTPGSRLWSVRSVAESSMIVGFLLALLALGVAVYRRRLS